MKKIIIKKKNKLYVEKDVVAFYCDFCGEKNVKVFESEYSDDKESSGKIEMQICYSCVKQLALFITK